MELLTKKYVYQIVGESSVGSNECIIKSEALSLATKNRKNVTSDLSTYSANEYIDKFEVEDMPDLRKFKFNKTTFQFDEYSNNGSSSVVSTDIDGNDIVFTALANVDWVNITKAADNMLEFTVNRNNGGIRSAKITGTNSTGFTDTINIQQDAYTPRYSHSYTLVIKDAASRPTKVVINNQEVTPVQQGSDYVCTYTYSSSNVDDAPQRVSYSIAGGLKSSYTVSSNASVSPLSWNLDDSLSKDFTVSVVDAVRTYSWDYQSGVDNFIAIDTQEQVDMKYSDTTQSVQADYTITTPTGVTATKNGMSFTATAGSTSNTGNMRVVCNGQTFDINIVYDPAIVSKTYTYTLSARGASSTPSMTINNQSITPTYASGVYTGVYSVTCPEGTQPATVNWSISGGVPSTDWGQYYISTSPSSWSQTGAGSKSFSISIHQDKTEYSWSKTSGTITYNSSDSCTIVSEDGTWSPSSGSNLSVSVDSPSWISTSVSGSTLTASIGNEDSDKSGSITLTTSYSDGTPGSCSISVSYTAPEPEETWPDWTYDFGFQNKGYLSNSTAIIYSYTGEFSDGLTEVVSQKRRTSNLGNVQTEAVSYTGSIWAPTGANSSEDDIVRAGTLTQAESGKTISWTVTQNGKPHEAVITGPYYDNFSDTSLSFTYQGGSKTVTCTKYYLRDGARYNESTESKTITCSENTSTSSKSWTETFNGQTINCTQAGKPESPVLGPFYTITTSSPLSFTAAGGTKTVNYTEYYTQGGTTYSSENKSATVSLDPLYSTNSGSGSLQVGNTGLTISYVQSANNRSAHSSATHSPNTMTWKGGTVNYTYEFYWTWDYGSSNKNVVASGSGSSTISEDQVGFISKVIYYNSVTGNGQPDYGLDYGSVTVWAYNIEKPSITGPYYKDFSTTELHFTSNGGSYTIQCTEYYLKGGEEYNSKAYRYTVSCEANESTETKTWTEKIGDQIITCIQDGKESTSYIFTYSTQVNGGYVTDKTQNIQYDASGKLTNYYPPYIISFKSEGGNTTTIAYSGGPSSPGVNESEEQIVTTGSYVQNESGNTLDWQVTQAANKKTYYGATLNDSNNPLVFNSTGGTATTTVTTWWQWDTSTDKHDEKTYDYTVTRPENTSANTINGYETFTNDGVSVKVYYTQTSASERSVNVSVDSDVTGDANGAGSVTVYIDTPVPFPVSVSGKVSASAANSGAPLNYDYSITIPANRGSASRSFLFGSSVNEYSYFSTISSVSPTTTTANGIKYTIDYVMSI